MEDKQLTTSAQMEKAFSRVEEKIEDSKDPDVSAIYYDNLNRLTLKSNIIVVPVTYLKTGREVNVAFKELAGHSGATYNTDDTSIKSIIKSDELNEFASYVNIALDNFAYVYAWYDNGTIYYWSKANKIYLNEDSSSMFNAFRWLTSLDVSNFDTSKATDMSNMFRFCDSFTSLDVSNFDTSNVTDMNGMFSFCESLTSLDVSNFDTSKVTDMIEMFSECKSLTSLNVSNFDTSNVTDMTEMFNHCESLTSLDVSNFDTSNVTDMNNMFCECKSLTSLDVSNFDTGNVTDMWGMFNFCESLTSLNVSNFDTSKVIGMTDMFSECESLTSLNVSNFDTGKVTDMVNMFCDDHMLTTIYSNDNNFVITEETYGFGMFGNCSSLIGGSGTVYDSSQIDESMAHVDILSNPGYFTLNPDVLKPLSECTVKEIQQIVQSGYADQVWSIGDTYPITLNGTVDAYTFNNETWYAEIIGFNHNAELETGGFPSVTFQFGENAGGTRIAFVDGKYGSQGYSAAFRMENDITMEYSGWERSYMRNTICPQFLEAMPQEWRNIIKPTVKYTDNAKELTRYAESNITATEDEIFLLAVNEVGVNSAAYNSYEDNYTKCYSGYATDNRIRFRHSNIDSTCSWWLRSPSLTNQSSTYATEGYLDVYFCEVSTNGAGSKSAGDYSEGFAPAFTIF